MLCPRCQSDWSPANILFDLNIFAFGLESRTVARDGGL
jgi:predicted  nucleic acid-binding Zn ribbon protein